MGHGIDEGMPGPAFRVAGGQGNGDMSVNVRVHSFSARIFDETSHVVASRVCQVASHFQAPTYLLICPPSYEYVPLLLHLPHHLELLR
jgi:hypothetical protein